MGTGYADTNFDTIFFIKEKVVQINFARNKSFPKSLEFYSTSPFSGLSTPIKQIFNRETLFSKMPRRICGIPFPEAV